jgi:hypothetical protein
MKTSSIIALLCIGGIIFYVTGGASLLGFGRTGPLPQTTQPPNATFMGNEQANPYAR